MFADAARRLAGLCGVMLGWRPAEFWTATPDEVAAIFDAMQGTGSVAAPPDAASLQHLQEMFPDG